EERPDLILFVLDASNLERNLFLLSQIAETDIPLLVAVTMADVVEREKGRLDLDAMQDLLNVPVVRVLAARRQGIDELKAAIEEALEKPHRAEFELGYPKLVADSVKEIREASAAEGKELTHRDALRCLLVGEEAWNEANLPEAARAMAAEKREVVLGAGVQGRTLDSQTRYAWASSVVHKVLQADESRMTLTDKIDRVLTHRVFGLAIFVAVMYIVFQFIYSLAGPFMDAIEGTFGAISGAVAPRLEDTPVLQSLVVDGVIAGVGAVLVFLPQILILFFFIAVLEGTGYLARASFLMDRLLGWCGLNGRAFIPLLSSFACAIPGIMAARVMPDSKSRLATVMVAPLMSCSARLPVYVLLIGAFIEPAYGPAWAGFALFIMHFVGLFVAIPVLFIFNRTFLKGKRLPFMLELPRYQWPRWKDVFLTLWRRGLVFLKTAGTIIFALSVVMWALLYFPRSEEKMESYREQYRELPVERQEQIPIENYVATQQTRDSYLGTLGRFVEPVFRPAGYDWRLTTAVLAAFPAREVVVSALGIIFSLGEEVDEGSTDLITQLQQAEWPDGRPLLTPWVAASLMVFFALCAQCMATLATIKRELNSWKWAWFSFAYMTGLAYLFAVGIYQLGQVLS
ncbi:MAG: ferrous iron transport protein B, partial [Fimbriimonadaceae bacterium]